MKIFPPLFLLKRGLFPLFGTVNDLEPLQNKIKTLQKSYDDTTGKLREVDTKLACWVDFKKHTQQASMFDNPETDLKDIEFELTDLQTKINYNLNLGSITEEDIFTPVNLEIICFIDPEANLDFNIIILIFKNLLLYCNSISFTWRPRISHLGLRQTTNPGDAS